jgi:tripartite-type tricarboxylate transporter receptor subunit TctC
MNKETRAAIADAGVQQSLALQALLPRSSTPDELLDRISNDIAKWRKIAAESGIKSE